MATQVNSRNVLLDIATTRTLANQKAVFVAASDLTFQYDSTGVLSGTPVIQITATKQNTTAPVTWTNNGGINLYSSATGGTVVTTDYSTGSTSTVYLRGINFYAAGLSSIRVMASISDIDVLTSSITVTKLQAGSTGVTGDSARIAYVVNTSATVPGAVTSGVGDVPPTSSAGTWSFTATSNLNVGEYMYQVEGKYSWITNTITWGNPYLSNLKVGSLSSLAVDTGNLTISTTGSIKTATNGTYGTAGGFFLGYDSDRYKFSIGDKLLYNGTTLTVPAITIDSSGNIAGIGTGAGTSVANNTNSVIRAPIGGVFATGAGTVTGSLKIRLPQYFTDSMLRFTVEIYEYSQGYMATIEIGGHNYKQNTTWYGVSARVIGSSNVEYPVYFGHDGTKCCIWIDGITSTWSYPQVRVRDVFIGFADYEKAKWDGSIDPWQISFDTQFLGTSGNTANKYSASVLDTLPGADWSKTSRIPSNLAALYGSEAIQNTLLEPSIAAKLSKSAADTLIGPISLASQGAITVGTPALNNISGNNGFYIGSTGIVATKNGVATVNITNGGDATFAGSLSAATGTLGALTINSGGNIKSGQTAYNTGTGFYIGSDAGVPKFSIGNSAGNHLKWDGSSLTFDTFSATIAAGSLTVSVASYVQTYGSRTVTVTGGVAPYSYTWITQTIGVPTGAYGQSDFTILSGAQTATASIGGYGNGCTITGLAACIVSDANGRTTIATISVQATHAYTAPPEIPPAVGNGY